MLRLCRQTGVKVEQEAGGLAGLYGSEHITRNTRTQGPPGEHGTVPGTVLFTSSVGGFNVHKDVRLSL